MVQPESQRKALRAAFRFAGLGLGSAIVSVPLAFTSTILMNPLLGRLEARYGVELTAHSGPADWIFGLVYAVTTVVLFTVLVLVTRGTSVASPNDGREKSPGNAT